MTDATQLARRHGEVLELFAGLAPPGIELRAAFGNRAGAGRVIAEAFVPTRTSSEAVRLRFMALLAAAATRC